MSLEKSLHATIRLHHEFSTVADLDHSTLDPTIPARQSNDFVC